MKKPFYTTFGLGILALVLVGFLLYKFWLITVSLIGGFLLYLLIDSFMEKLERKGVTGLAAYGVLALCLSVTVLVFALFVAIPLGEQAHSFASQLPQFIDELNQKLESLQENFPFVMTVYESVKGRLFSSLTEILSHTGSVLTSIFAMLLMSIILLASRRTLRQSLIEKIPNDYFEVVVSIAHRIVGHIKQYVAAKSVETVIMTLIYFVGFWTIGLPMPLLLAMAGGLLNLIPYIGVIFTAIPIGIAALLTGGYTQVGLAMLVLLVARMIDDFVLQTYLVGHFVDVHPFTVVLITLIGGEAMGVIGLVVAIPVFVISRIVILGLYEYLRSVQRHEIFLQEEEHENKNHAGKQQHQVNADIL